MAAWASGAWAAGAWAGTAWEEGAAAAPVIQTSGGASFSDRLPLEPRLEPEDDSDAQDVLNIIAALAAVGAV